MMLQCNVMLDWCIVASTHVDNILHSSILATSMDAMVMSDDVFHRWVQCRLDSTLGIMPPNPPPPIPAPSAGHTAPLDVWTQVAANLTQSIVNAASAMNPVAPAAVVHAQASNYEEGGKFYDSYQLAILQGFAHTPTVTGVPPIWALFQHTKHINTHMDNIKKAMMEWS
jgi:hypothetical protein